MDGPYQLTMPSTDYKQIKNSPNKNNYYIIALQQDRLVVFLQNIVIYAAFFGE